MGKSMDDAIDTALAGLVALGLWIIIGLVAAGIWLVFVVLYNLYRRQRMAAAAQEEWRLLMLEEGMGFKTDDVVNAVFADEGSYGGVKFDDKRQGKDFPMF